MLAPPTWLPLSAAHEAQRLLSVESVDGALVVRLAKMSACGQYGEK